MEDLQILKDEISNNKFNKRIFYAKNALRYTDIMPLNYFVDNYIPFITNYIFNEENVEEVLTEYSNTFVYFLKFLGKNENYMNYEANKDKDKMLEDNNSYNNSINLILHCFFEKMLINEDEILKETTINNIKEILLNLDEFPLLKNEFENILHNLKILNNENDENKDIINDENEINILFFSLLYPFIITDQKNVENFCNKFSINISGNPYRRKKRLLIQNIINIIPFIKKSINNFSDEDKNNNENYLKMNQINIYLLKEIISALSKIMDEKNLIISVGMNYLCEIILTYTIKNTTDIILFYDEYNKYLSNNEIDLIINNFISKLENFINNETTLKVNLTWRVKVAYVENICKLKKFIDNHNQKYFNEYYSQFCESILNGNNIEPDLKIAVLKNIEVLIPSIDRFIQIFNNMILMERNKYILSSLGIALNRIMNNKTFYELYNNNENLSNIFGQFFQFINNLINNNNFEVKYHVLSSFDFCFFNFINNDKEKISLLNESLKLYILVFQKINEWRIRFNLFEKFKNFILEKDNILKIFSFIYLLKNNPENENNILELINNIRNLFHLFFLDKANIIRMNSLELINNIITFQKDNKISEEIHLIRIKEELIKYQVSIFSKNSISEENIINNLNLLDINKTYCMKLFFLESVKKFINLYTPHEKNIINDILKLIKNESKYSKENIANNKINSDIDNIIGNLKNITN
jgi:hypothetical protein